MKVLKGKSQENLSCSSLRRTPDSVRMACVIEVLNGSKRSDVALKYNVDPTSISRWKRIFASRKEIQELIAMKHMAQEEYKASASMRTEQEVSLSQEVADLKSQLCSKEKELLDLQKRLDVANTMIDVAEKLFHIEIKKKLGSPQ